MYTPGEYMGIPRPGISISMLDALLLHARLQILRQESCRWPNPLICDFVRQRFPSEDSRSPREQCTVNRVNGQTYGAACLGVIFSFTYTRLQALHTVI